MKSGRCRVGAKAGAAGGDRISLSERGLGCCERRPGSARADGSARASGQESEWSRPQKGTRDARTEETIEAESESKPGKRPAGELPWPETLSERVKAVSTALAAVKEPVTAPEVARCFGRARASEAGEILETLCAVGKARRGNGQGTFLP